MFTNGISFPPGYEFYRRKLGSGWRVRPRTLEKCIPAPSPETLHEYAYVLSMSQASRPHSILCLFLCMISLHYHRDDPVYIIRQRLFVADRYILYSFIFVCVYLDSGPLFSHVFCSEGTLSWMWKSFLVSKFYIF